MTKWSDSLCGAKTAGLIISKCKPCSPGRKVAHWLMVKGWGVGCLTTTILRCTIASCMPWCSLPWKRNEFPRQACTASVPHHNSLTFLPPFFSYSPTGSTWLMHGVENSSLPGLRATSQNILWSTTKVNEACARPPHVA